MHADSITLAGILFVSCLMAGIDVAMKMKDEYKTANQLSVHAYQSNIGSSISMAGPFLSKVRVTPNTTRLLTATPELTLQAETYCMKLPVETQAQCNASSAAPMYFGDIHSSWSVLGTQSTFTLVKHIFFVLVTFSIFWMSEHEIQIDNNFFSRNHKPVRVAVLIVAICAFVLNVILDIQQDMYQKDTVAIGSITTGISFCVVLLLIICFTHLHDPDSEPTKKSPQAVVGDPDTETAVLMPAQSEIQTFEMPKLSFPRFELWSPQKTVQTSDAHRYTRLQDMYLNIYGAYLVLLVMPLFTVLALTMMKQVVVDVFVQLIFFSSIFFAVLDIFQTRVMSVLASLTQTGSSVPTGVPAPPVGFFFVKCFVVLAFILCKLLVIVPAWQLLLKYYALDESQSWWLVVWQIVLFALASVCDLAYISDMFNGTPAPTVETQDAQVKPTSPEKRHVFFKQLIVGFYLVTSSATVFAVA